MFSVLFTILYIIRAYAVCTRITQYYCVRVTVIETIWWVSPEPDIRDIYSIHPRRGQYNSILLLLYVHDDLCILRSSILGQ